MTVLFRRHERRRWSAIARHERTNEPCSEHRERNPNTTTLPMLALGLGNRLLAHDYMRRCPPPSLNAREKNLDAIYSSSGSSYLQETRERMLGSVPSHVLLDSDNKNDLLPSGLTRDASALQFVFVDEPRCIGCRTCAEVARSTFRMEEEFGAARVFQQRGDDADVIEEAVLCCPVDCIHEVSFNELRILERHRARTLDDGSMAAAQGAGKIAARAEGRDGAPNWRAPLVGMSRDASGLEPPLDDDQGALNAREPGRDNGRAGALSDMEADYSYNSSAALFAGAEADAIFDGKVDEERPAPGADKDVFDALFGGYVEPVLDDDEAIM